MVGHILRTVALRPNKTFMIEDLGEGSWREWSYGELGARAGAVACWLRCRQGQEKAVALCGSPSFDQIAFCLGAWTLGIPTHPLDTLSTKEELRQLLIASKVKFVYCSSSEDRYVMESLGAGVEVIDGRLVLDTTAPLLPPEPLQPLPEVQCIVYSSGTTAQPKAVKVTSRALIFMSSLFEMETGSVDRVLVVGMPFWMSYSVMINHCMKNGKTIIMPKRPNNFQDIFRILHLHKPQFWLALPHLLLAMAGMEPGPGPVSCFKAVHVSGYSLSGDKKELIRERVTGVNVKHWYATSETGNITYWPGEPPHTCSPSVGHVCPGALLKVVDSKTGETLGPDSAGEIWVKTESMMEGYLGLDGGLQEDGWFKTGDIGYYDREELLYFVSRQKDIIRYLWLKIVPSELEGVLACHPGVQEVVVAGRPHATDGEHPTAFVIPRPDWEGRLTESHLHSYLAERVSETKRLRGGIYFIKSIPRGSTGKILRKNLVGMVNSQSQGSVASYQQHQGYRRQFGPGQLAPLPFIRPASAVTN